MAMVKHFIAYDGGNNVVLDEQTLHEIYLEPFADAINAGVASVMCSYNTLNVVAAKPATGGTAGPYSCGNSQTLTGILRGELGFKGFVTSDWGANKATNFINDGLDMEMPGTGFGGILPTYFSAADLKAAITAARSAWPRSTRRSATSCPRWAGSACCLATPSTTSPRSRSTPTSRWSSRPPRTPPPCSRTTPARCRSRTPTSATWR